MPVAISALIWSICVLIILLSPTSSRVSMVIVAGLLAVGGLYFGYMMLFNGKVLDHEPGEDTFAAAESSE